MKRILFLTLALALLLTLTVTPVMAGGNGNGAYRGEAPDPLYDELGTIKYLSNPAGYHFWFTVSDDLSVYLEGHSYHNVYKVKVNNQSEWAGPIQVPISGGRAPYNLVGHEGEWVYYKIFDTTTDTQVLP